VLHELIGWQQPYNTIVKPKIIRKGTVSKILSRSDVKPHKISCYLEKKDADFDRKMTQILHVYKEVELYKAKDDNKQMVAILSYDEKPGIQAIENIAPEFKIKIILDNHSSHISKETKAFLKTVTNRFEFVFTPTHASWLNLIEVFFSKMTRSFLRGIRVKSKAELKERILNYLDEVNEMPTIFKWKWKMEDIIVG